MRRACSAAVAAALLAGCGGGGSTSSGVAPPISTPTPTGVPIAATIRISRDEFENATSQHATEVEPALAAHRSTVVATFQSGRFVLAGASGIGFSTSLDAGRTWQSGVLPGLTRVQEPSAAFDSASDPNVVYDAAHHVWLISSLPVLNSGKPTPAALVSRSRDGLSWSLPVLVNPGQTAADKTWITCDDWAPSPFYGRCYLEWDDPNADDLVHMSTSSDGGLNWSRGVTTVDSTLGLGGQPVVQPNGTVIVPMDDPHQVNIIAFSSTDGGASWHASVHVSDVPSHLVNGGLRTSPLPSAAVDGQGVVYVVWQDCRFRVDCASNDLVLSTSTNGTAWTKPRRVPIDPVSGTADHFIPGLAADPNSGGQDARLSLAYYYYPIANCVPASCRLSVGFVGSMDGGASWSAQQTFSAPMSLGWLPRTRDGLMVGDYIASVFAEGAPFAAFAVAQPLAGPRFDEATYVPAQRPALWEAGPFRRASAQGANPDAVSDHPPRPPRPDDD